MDTRVIQMVLNSVGMVRQQAPTLSTQAVETFLMIAMNPNITMVEIAKRLKIQAANVSKNMSTMTKYQKVTPDGLRIEGLDWITMEEDPTFRARKLLNVTAKGRRLVEAMSEHALHVMARRKAEA